MGDGWMPYLFSPRRYRSSVETVREVARGAGRDLDRFAWMAWVYTSVDEDGDRARRDLASWLGGTYRQDFEEMLNRVAAAGTPDEVVERFCEYIEAGVRHFVIAAPGTADPNSRQRELLYGTVLPRLREHWPEHVSNHARS